MDRVAHLVIPCYNEANRLPFDEVFDLLAVEQGLHLAFSDDGSTDQTVERLLRLQRAYPARVHIHRLSKNAGKGEAVRQGLLAAVERWSGAGYYGYFDADMAAPLVEAFHMIRRLSPQRPFIIMGSRVDLLGTTDIKRSLYRHYFGRVFATMVSLQLGVAVYDTQCGAKLIRGDQVKSLCSEPFLTRWLFDVELLWRCMALSGRAGLRDCVAEVPLSHWHEQGDSKVRLSDALKVPLGLRRIARHYRGRVRK